VPVIVGPRRTPVAATPSGPVSEIIVGDQVEEVQFERDGTKSVTVQPKRRQR
jgi:hypothetical protein